MADGRHVSRAARAPVGGAASGREPPPGRFARLRSGSTSSRRSRSRSPTRPSPSGRRSGSPARSSRATRRQARACSRCTTASASAGSARTGAGRRLRHRRLRLQARGGRQDAVRISLQRSTLAAGFALADEPVGRRSATDRSTSDVSQCQLVLHADDFGASADTVRATIDCFEQGALTSASIMPPCPATAEAIAFASSAPGPRLRRPSDVRAREGDERPLSEPDGSPGSWTRTDGSSRRGRSALVRFCGACPSSRSRARSPRRSPPCATRASSLPRRLAPPCPQAAGPSGGARPCAACVRDRRVRAVQDVYLRKPRTSPTYWLGGRWQKALARAFTTTAHMYMPTSAGDVAWEQPLAEIARELDGTLEVGVHPGYQADWRAASATRRSRSRQLPASAATPSCRGPTSDRRRGRDWRQVALVGPEAAQAAFVRRATRLRPRMAAGGSIPRSSSTVGAMSSRWASTRTAGLDARAREHEEPVLRVVRVVGAGVVLEGVDAVAAAHRADRAPEEIAEVDDEVGSDAGDLRVDVLRLVDDGRRWPGSRARPGWRRAVRARSSRTRSYSVGSTTPSGSRPLTFMKIARVVAALAPGDGPRPVDARRRASFEVAVRLVARRAAPPGEATR